jgi:hypothetical protein
VRETLAEINHFKHFLLVVSPNKAFDVLKKQLKEQKLKQILEKELVTTKKILNLNCSAQIKLLTKFQKTIYEK